MRWSRSTGGQVVGSLSAIGEIVYVAEFTNQRTIGYMMHSGRKVFTYPKGTYTPIISDGQDLYLTGYSSITALEPVHPVKPKIARDRRAGSALRSHARGEGSATAGRAAPRRSAALSGFDAAGRRRRQAAARPARKPGNARSEAGR